MRRILIFFMLLSSSGYASDVFIKADDEFGQGMFRARGLECFLVSPKHVVGDAGDAVTLRTEGKREYAGDVEKVYDVDLAIVLVKDGDVCRNTQWNSGIRLRELLNKHAEGMLETRRDNGSMVRTPVQIVEKGDTTYLEVKLLESENNVMQGFSGSVLTINGERAGILLAVSDNDKGRILRQDFIHNTVKTFFDAVKTPLAEIIGDKDLNEYSTVVANYKGNIKQGEVLDYRLGLDNNSPVMFQIDKTEGGAQFSLDLFDSRQKLVKSWPHLGGGKQDLIFTAQANDRYALRLKGEKNSGAYNIDVKLIRSDNELRSKNNKVKLDVPIEGRIAELAVAEYHYKAEENEPVLLTFLATDNGMRYDLVIEDRRHNVIKALKAVGSENTEVLFTPPKRDRYIFRLTGTRNYGVFSFNLKKLGKSDWFQDKHKLEFDEPVDGLIVEGASAEFRFTAKENSPLVFAVEAEKPGITYTVEVEGKFRKKVQQWQGKDKYGEFVFTPPKSANYTLRITGTRSYSEASIELQEVGASADEPVNNIEIDQMVDSQIARGEQKEYVFRADRNSPFLISLQEVDEGVRFDMEVIDPRGQVAKTVAELGKDPQEIAFTPQYDGFHKIRVKGLASFGEFSFSVEQIASNHELMNGGNRVKVNRSPVESVIAEGAVAQYNLDSYTNKDIVIVAGSMSGGGSYSVELYGLNGALIKQWKNLGGKQSELKISLPKPGFYALKVIGEKHYGEYSLSAVADRFR